MLSSSDRMRTPTFASNMDESLRSKQLDNFRMLANSFRETIMNSVCDQARAILVEDGLSEDLADDLRALWGDDYAKRSKLQPLHHMGLNNMPMQQHHQQPPQQPSMMALPPPATNSDYMRPSNNTLDPPNQPQQQIRAMENYPNHHHGGMMMVGTPTTTYGVAGKRRRISSGAVGGGGEPQSNEEAVYNTNVNTTSSSKRSRQSRRHAKRIDKDLLSETLDSDDDPTDEEDDYDETDGVFGMGQMIPAIANDDGSGSSVPSSYPRQQFQLQQQQQQQQHHQYQPKSSAEDMSLILGYFNKVGKNKHKLWHIDLHNCILQIQHGQDMLEVPLQDAKVDAEWK